MECEHRGLFEHKMVLLSALEWATQNHSIQKCASEQLRSVLQPPPPIDRWPRQNTTSPVAPFKGIMSPFCVLPQHAQAGQVCPFAQAGDTRSGRIQHVCVGKYAAPQVFLSDREWCAKNSLHPYRLTLLNFEGQSHEATAPVPADLVLAFTCLEPKRPVSAEVLDDWLQTARRFAIGHCTMLIPCLIRSS